MKVYQLTIDDIKDVVNNFKVGYNSESSVCPTIKNVEDELKLEGYLKSRYYDKEV